MPRLKIDKVSTAVFLGAIIYYLGETIYRACTTDDLNRIYISAILCIVTVALCAIWILHDYCLQLVSICRDLDEKLHKLSEDTKDKFDVVNENLDRLYINDRYVVREDSNEILYK